MDQQYFKLLNNSINTNLKKKAVNLMTALSKLIIFYLSDQVGIGYFSLQAANSKGYTVQYFPF